MLPALVVLLLAIAPAQAISLHTPAPGFTLKDSRQHPHTLSDYRGQIVLINFWASWCAPCQQELPELNRLAAHYRGKLRVLAVNIDTDRHAAHTALGRLGLTNSSLEILWDSKSKVVSRYNIETMPSSYILDARGVVRAIHSGFHPTDPAEWRGEIDALLKK